MTDYARSSDDEDNDDYGLLKQALDVKLPPDFDPHKAPQTGEEYLQHVIYERNHCRTWLTVGIDKNKFKDKQTFKIQADSIIDTPTAFRPTRDWQNKTIENFALFRSYIQYKLAAEGGGGVNGSDGDCSLDEAAFLARITSQPVVAAPSLSEMKTYTQAAKVRMLEIIGKYLLGGGLEPGAGIEPSGIGTWLYAVFALLEIPLNPSYCHTLREFARKCIVMRSRLADDQHELAAPLNLFICIVARYFNQLDLAD